MRPLPLPPNRLHRFYRGGEAIARFRGVPLDDEHAPEDWVGATSTVFGESELGLSRLPDGRLLRDVVAADPAAWLGPGREEPGLLVKLLDAGERLPVHLHPDRAFARAHLGSRYGKSEAWAIVEARGEPVVGVGFREEVDGATLRDWVDRQDVPALLAALNELRVEPGDVVFVPGGVPHAIGGGILMVELQEPTDFSILLDWQGYEIDGPRDGHLGLGFDTALQAVDRSAWTPERLEATVVHTGHGERERLVPAAAEPFFRGERLRPAGELELEPSFAILVVVGGTGRLEGEHGGLDLRRGVTAVVPHGAGATVLSGGLDLIRCLPPALSS